MENKKGSLAGAWIILFALMLIAVIAIVYLTATPIIEKIENKTINTIVEPDRIETVGKIKDAWTNWPGISLFAVILMVIVAIIASSRKEPYQYQ